MATRYCASSIYNFEYLSSCETEKETVLYHLFIYLHIQLNNNFMTTCGFSGENMRVNLQTDMGKGSGTRLGFH